MKTMLLAVMLLLPCFAKAQTPAPQSDFQNLMTWVGNQQAQAGTASPVRGQLFKSTYAATWWDAVSFGQAGLNVGRAGASDYVDIGPAMDVATGKITRYGVAIPIHFGNIWNDIGSRLPANIASHVHLASIPNVIACAEPLWPVGRPLNKWTWSDFMVAVGYRFGGS